MQRTKIPASESSERRAYNSEHACEQTVHPRLIESPRGKVKALRQCAALQPGRKTRNLDGQEPDMSPAHSPLARFPILPAQIETVVHAFYAAVRSHQVLAPIFASHITDWPAHETKIALFWRSTTWCIAGPRTAT